MKVGGLLTVLAVGVAVLIFQLRTSNKKLEKREIAVQSYSENMEELFELNKVALGDDLGAYRGHCYRVLSYSLHYLASEPSWTRRSKELLPVLEASIFFHGIGLWTDKRLSYLEPSSRRGKMWAKKYGKFMNGLFTEEEFTLMDNIIHSYHKLTPFEGKYARIVNAVRMAGWIDLSYGLVNLGMPRAHILKVGNEISYDGFHGMLFTIGHRYYGWDVYRIISEISSVLKL